MSILDKVKTMVGNYSELIVALFILMALIVFFSWYVQKPESAVPVCDYCKKIVVIEDDYVVDREQHYWHANCYLDKMEEDKNETD